MRRHQLIQSNKGSFEQSREKSDAWFDLKSQTNPHIKQQLVATKNVHMCITYTHCEYVQVQD